MVAMVILCIFMYHAAFSIAPQVIYDIAQRESHESEKEREMNLCKQMHCHCVCGVDFTHSRCACDYDALCH